MTWESILPFIALPTLALSATLGPYYTILAFAVLFFGLCFLHHWFMKNNPKTKFYLYWTIASSISILLVFEIFFQIRPLNAELIKFSNYIPKM